MKSKILLLSFFSFLFLLSCSSDNCDYNDTTNSYEKIEDFSTTTVGGVYKLSSLSTDNTFDKSQLANSALYVITDSLNPMGLNGKFYFHDYPAWDNASSRNNLEDFYGEWHITFQSALIGGKRFHFEPMYFADFEKVSPKSMVAALDVRLSNGNPVIIVRVLRNFTTDAKFGYSLIYSTPESKDFCNYLVFEKVSPVVSDSIKSQTMDYIKPFYNF